MYQPQVPRAKRAVSMRGEQVGFAGADDVRVQRAVVRAVRLHLRTAETVTQHANLSGALISTE